MTYRPNVHSASNLSSLYLLFILNLTNSASPSISCQHELRQQQSRAPVSSSRVQPRSSGAGGGEKKPVSFTCVGDLQQRSRGESKWDRSAQSLSSARFTDKPQHSVNNVTRFSTLDNAAGGGGRGAVGTAVFRSGGISEQRCVGMESCPRFFFSTRQVPSTSRLDS